jgi:hypothetical protein
LCLALVSAPHCDRSIDKNNPGTEAPGLFSCLLFKGCCYIGSGQIPVYVVYVVSLLFLSLPCLEDMGSGQIPVADEIPEVSETEPAERVAGATAENAKAPAKTAAAAIFLNM